MCASQPHDLNLASMNSALALSCGEPTWLGPADICCNQSRRSAGSSCASKRCSRLCSCVAPLLVKPSRVPCPWSSAGVAAAAANVARAQPTATANRTRIFIPVSRYTRIPHWERSPRAGQVSGVTRCIRFAQVRERIRTRAHPLEAPGTRQSSGRGVNCALGAFDQGSEMRKIFWLLVFVAPLTAPAANAAGLKVRIVDQRGAPVADAVVTVVSRDAASLPKPAHKPETRVIDQKNLMFVPYVEVFRPGDSVVFRNSDNTRHHVYSFSP